MIIEIAFPGKTREDYLTAGIEDFAARLGRYAQVEIRVARQSRDTGSQPPALIMEEEGKRLLALVSPGAMVVALDRKGRQCSSEDLACRLQSWRDEGRGTIAFVIGGHHGLADAVLARAAFVLSLSLMTFTHEMARLILLEQVYRAFTIMAGTAYHK